MPVISKTCGPSRYHPRVRAGFMVTVGLNGRQVLTKAADLSMDGLLLRGDLGALVSGDRLSVRIPLPADREIATEATIVRRDDEWAALKLDDLDWDDLLALARFVHPRLAT